jgi:xanthine dehydrogenase accessory factor
MIAQPHPSPNPMGSDPATKVSSAVIAACPPKGSDPATEVSSAVIADGPAPPAAADRRATALAWLDAGRRVAAATLVEAIGSAPLEPGACMLVDDLGRIEGSVTGGCVEAALVGEAQDVLAGGPPRVARFGVADGDVATGVGLTCGGTVEVFVQALDDAVRPALSRVDEAVARGAPAVLATLLDGPAAGGMRAILIEEAIGSLGAGDRLDAAVERDALGLLAGGRSAVRRYDAHRSILGDALRVHLQVFAPPPAMVIFGASDFSAALAEAAAPLGFATTICDARSAFASSPRFARHADVVVAWPDHFLSGRALGPGDAVLVLTHDPKFDVPAVTAALRSGAGFVGALGSRRTHADRCDRLRRAGVPEDEIARIASPCGLDLGARTPAETAISILAEVIARRAGRTGRSLSTTRGSIHDRRAGPIAFADRP